MPRGGLGGLMGGGAMAVLGKLQALGLGMGEIQSVTQETIDFARREGRRRISSTISSRRSPGLGSSSDETFLPR